MTVDELHDVLATRLDQMEDGRRERHAEVLRRLDSINGKVNRHDTEIGNLKVRDAYTAGASGTLSLLLGWIAHRLF